MAVASGITGSITLPTGFNIKSNSWSLTIGQVVNNITGFSDGGYRTMQGALIFGDWSSTGHMEYNAADKAPFETTGKPLSQESASTVFTVATGCTITAGAVIAAVPMGVDVNGDATIGYSGPLSGAIVVAWDETT
jgi:hypothetical protein